MIPTRLIEGPNASLEELLLRREQRAMVQKELLERGGTLVSFTMNIPGQRKQFPLERLGFEEGMRELQRCFAGAILEERAYSGPTGEELLLRLDRPARWVKEQTVALEETHPLGRLWDMDVLDGGSLSRTALGLPQRRCLVCGESAKVCARSRRHSIEEVFDRAAGQLYDYFRCKESRRVGNCALRAVLWEVSVTPKPGLVDRHDSGSHADMDFFTFVDSSAALAPWFSRFFLAGWDGAEGLFDRLRALGQQAEAEMFDATGGVNTHKGLIFSMSILCGALGRAGEESFPERPAWEAVMQAARQLGKASLRDFAAGEGQTAGLRCYQTHGMTGIRGEAAAGFPAVFEVGLPALRRWLDRGASLNDGAAAALLALIAAVDDTNMIHRGGCAEAAARKREAAKLSAQLTEETLVPALEMLNADYIRHHLSPGGCADLLALTLFWHLLTE
ncbi:MAG: citrate lyase holo-[Oscillibacter sp.]|nr:citrate lyase holo-[acyl-carrier protein] synthase [Oscillibacter sp.]